MEYNNTCWLYFIIYTLYKCLISQINSDKMCYCSCKNIKTENKSFFMKNLQNYMLSKNSHNENNNCKQLKTFTVPRLIYINRAVCKKLYSFSQRNSLNELKGK